MDPSIICVLEQCTRDSDAGAISFNTIVDRLATAGIESYQADFRGRTITYYLPNGESHALPLVPPTAAISECFNPQALRIAIRSAQLGEVKEAEFMQQSMAAGCVGYAVWITGQHITYFGRRGEVLAEPFPPCA